MCKSAMLQPWQHMTSATAITACKALEIEREEMVRRMLEEPSFSELFLRFLLVRSIRTQADLIPPGEFLSEIGRIVDAAVPIPARSTTLRPPDGSSHASKHRAQVINCDHTQDVHRG